MGKPYPPPLAKIATSYGTNVDILIYTHLFWFTKPQFIALKREALSCYVKTSEHGH